MRRREFIGLLGGAAVWPLVARAQPKEKPIVGVLRLDNEQHWFLESLREGLRDHGLKRGSTLSSLFALQTGTQRNFLAACASLPLPAAV